MKAISDHISTIIIAGGCNMRKKYERRSFLKCLLSLSAFIAGSTISSNQFSANKEQRQDEKDCG
jgi:hypothetical protein